jgi:hypothetical protein
MSSPKLIRLGESADKRVTTKRREINDRMVERALDTGTSGLSTNQAISTCTCLDQGMHTPAMERDEKGAITYTTLKMPTGLATLTWWNTEAGRGCHYPLAPTRSP